MFDQVISDTSPTAERIVFFKHKLCGRPPQSCPRPLQVDLWPFDIESGVRLGVTRDVAYLCANFNLPTPLCSRLRSDICDRRQMRMPPTLGAGA